MRRHGPSTTALRTASRLAAGFVTGLLLWIALFPAYERALAATAERLIRLTEWPAVTRLEARPGEILIERQDFPPAAPRPGMPAADLHFNFVLLVALFALADRPWRGEWIARFLLASLLLWLVHLTAVVFEVRSIYATRLGPWSAAHYGAFARNVWAGGFHFYQIAGRFAAPFALWWPFARLDWTARTRPATRRGRPLRKGRREGGGPRPAHSA
jgi:hypothetical protein